MSTPTTTPSTPSTDDQLRESGRSAVEISTALADLRVAGGAVGGRQWLSPEFAGEPAVSIELLGSTAKPLSALASAGCDLLTPMISFLEEPLDTLRGEPGSVSTSAGGTERAAGDTGEIADDYRATTERETSEWSGPAKRKYTVTADKLVDGIGSVAEAAATNAKAMTAAGEVVAQAVDIVTRLITEAVGAIVPIMTKAIAAAPATFGASIAQAIPECVAIAVDYGNRIAGKLAALLASGENLVRLLEGAAGALDVVKTGLDAISELAGGGSTGESSANGSTGTPPDEQT